MQGQKTSKYFRRKKKPETKSAFAAQLADLMKVKEPEVPEPRQLSQLKFPLIKDEYSLEYLLNDLLGAEQAKIVMQVNFEDVKDEDREDDMSVSPDAVPALESKEQDDEDKGVTDRTNIIEN